MEALVLVDGGALPLTHLKPLIGDPQVEYRSQDSYACERFLVALSGAI